MLLPRVRLPRFARSRLVAPLAAVLVGLLVAGCSSVPGLYPPNAVTTQGEATRNLYTIVFLIAVVIFFVVEGLILFAAVRYHRRPARDATDPARETMPSELPRQIHGHNALEILWTVIPVAIVLFLFVASWQTLNTVQARAADPATRITVVGFQWQWQFIYPDPASPNDPKKAVSIVGLPTAPPELHVPAGETVEISLQGKDVIHAFYVPQFLFKEDVVPGRNNVFQFKIDQPGTYRGQCAEFCGLGHAQMAFTVVAQTPDQFQAWLAAERQKAQATPTPIPSAATSGSPSPSGPGAGGATLQIAAQNTAFSVGTLSAPANTPFAIAFTNNDSGVPHNVAIKDASGNLPFHGDLITGPASATYQVPALPTGTYTFFCQVHPNMTGTLTVK